MITLSLLLLGGAVIALNISLQLSLRRTGMIQDTLAEMFARLDKIDLTLRQGPVQGGPLAPDKTIPRPPLGNLPHHGGGRQQ
jgi:hypothetical protein